MAFKIGNTVCNKELNLYYGNSKDKSNDIKWQKVFFLKSKSLKHDMLLEKRRKICIMHLDIEPLHISFVIEKRWEIVSSHRRFSPKCKWKYVMPLIF